MLTLIALLTLASITAAPASAEAGPAKKGVNRVTLAASSGEFTARELQAVKEDQAALASYLDFAQRDGRINKAERQQLDRLEDRMERKLTRLANNERSRR